MKFMEGQSERSSLNKNKNSPFNKNQQNINLYKSTDNEILNIQNIGINKIINQSFNRD